MSSPESTSKVPTVVVGTSTAAPAPPAKVTSASASGPPKNYRIVKVEMPDGSIKKVKRTIIPTSTTETTSSHVATPKTTKIAPTATITAGKVPGEPKKAVDVKEPTSIAEEKEPQTTPKVAADTAAEKDSKVPPTGLTKPEEHPASKVDEHHVTKTENHPVPKTEEHSAQKADAKNTTLQKNTLFAARFFRNFRTLHRGVAQAAAVFDPDCDVVMGDEDDEPEDDSDDYDDDNSVDHDDDNDNESRHNQDEDDNDQNERDEFTTNHNGEATARGDRDEMAPLSQDANTLVHGIYGAPLTTPKPKPGTSIKVAPTSKPSPTTNQVRSRKQETEKSMTEIQEKPVDEDKHEDRKAPVKKSTFFRWLSFSLSRLVIIIITIVLPLFYFVLGILTAKITGYSSDSSLGKGVHQAITIAITAWPIMFAAIVAQSLKALATYRVERGIRLMTLEQLINSHSVATAIKQPFLLQRFDWTTIALLCLWSLSPLASQALQRMSWIGIDGSMNTTSVEYLSTLQKPLGFGILSPATNIIYGASILTPPVNAFQPMDDWNNPKIPILENLKNKDGSGWYLVDPIPANAGKTNNYPPYASLVGISLSGPEDGVNMTFSVESSYFVLNCPDFQQVTTPGQIPGSPTLSSSGGGTLRMGITSTMGTGNSSNTTTTSNIQKGSWTIVLKQEDMGDTSYGYTTCAFSQSFVESHIICAGTNCAVDKMRRSRKNTANTLDIGDLHDFMDAFATSDGSNSSEIRTRTEEYIYGGPRAAGTYKGDDFEQYSIFNTPKSLTDQALPLIFNTYWQAGLVPYQTTTLDLTELQAGMNSESIITNPSATSTRTDLVYATSTGWLVVLFLCSAVLLLAGLSSVVFASLTVSPDFLGFASTVLRKTKYVNMPKLDKDVEGGGASGAQRARRLADVRVMVQDAKAEDPVGKIVLGPAGKEARPLRRDRIYR